MKHWHKCSRWKRKDFVCPFGHYPGHPNEDDQDRDDDQDDDDKDDDDDADDKKIPVPGRKLPFVQGPILQAVSAIVLEMENNGNHPLDVDAVKERVHRGGQKIPTNEIQRELEEARVQGRPLGGPEPKREEPFTELSRDSMTKGVQRLRQYGEPSPSKEQPYWGPDSQQLYGQPRPTQKKPYKNIPKEVEKQLPDFMKRYWRVYEIVAEELGWKMQSGLDSPKDHPSEVRPYRETTRTSIPTIPRALFPIGEALGGLSGFQQEWFQQLGPQ